MLEDRRSMLPYFFFPGEKSRAETRLLFQISNLYSYLYLYSHLNFAVVGIKLKFNFGNMDIGTFCQVLPRIYSAPTGHTVSQCTVASHLPVTCKADIVFYLVFLPYERSPPTFQLQLEENQTIICYSSFF